MFQRFSSRSPGRIPVFLLLIPALLFQALHPPRPPTLMLLLLRPTLFPLLAPAASALPLFPAIRLVIFRALRPSVSSQPLSGSPLLCSPSGSACGFWSL